MKYFTDNAIKTSKENALKAYHAIVSYAPDKKLPREIIDILRFTLRDYIDELESMEYKREKEARKHFQRRKQ